jgi:transcription elongation factor Elf1
MAKVAKTADRSKMMDTAKGIECPKCNKATRIVKRVKDRERGVPGGVYISCSACDFYEKLEVDAIPITACISARIDLAAAPGSTARVIGRPTTR